MAGTTLAGRYRIVSLLGKGGMGEVFRAEDLRLSQTVALKFLPVATAEDETAREQFYQEARLAREISHPNVCRVFDIGEADGRLFLAMEYVDGEDLASLLRRIGHLPQNKALDIARQICAGLAAAHDHGVLHRDLKPSNIMLDGRGRVRVADFGLAALAENLSAAEAGAGTPAYMAPEQLAGVEATPRSDIYSLGLVLYEIFTGKKVFEAATLQDLIHLRAHSTPSSLSTIVKDIDPLVERVVLRCLEKDPAKRPATALQVAAALPGGDPLAAALAAGETPSPQMVAEAGGKEGLRPAIAWACLVLIVLGLAAAAAFSEKVELSNLVPLPSPPAVLAAKAHDMAREFGYTDTPVDTAYSFSSSPEYLLYIEQNDRSLTRWKNLSSGVPPVIVFWYRESPGFMRAERFDPFPSVEDFDPRDSPGMCQIYLDTLGHLVEFEAVPPQIDTPTQAANAPNWGSLFAAAGLDASGFKAVPPQWTARVTSDARAAWEGAWPERPDLSLRVEAAAYRGKPVYFNLVSPWTMQEDPSSASQSIQTAIVLSAYFSMVLLGLVLARKNARSGRGDRRGAARLALLAFLFMWVAAGLYARHVPALGEFWTLLMATGWGLIAAAFAWVLYVALEPYVRKRWPSSLISWTRLLAGQMRDPLVGRDLVVGILTGVFWEAADQAVRIAPGWMGKTLPTPVTIGYESWTGLRPMIGAFLGNVMVSVLGSLGFFFIFFFIRLVLRKEWLAVVVTLLLCSLPSVLGGHPFLQTASGLVLWAIALAVLVRFGLLALVVALCTNELLDVYPLTVHLSAWFAEPTIFVFFVIVAAAIFGFHTSTAGKPLFGGALLDA